MGAGVSVQYGVGGDRLPGRSEIARWVASALGRERADAEVTVRVVDAGEAADLNQSYRHRSGPTNVLSFPVDLPAGVPVPLLGDIVICAPVVIREAEEQNKDARHHWAHLVVHGTLHLLGFDHEAPAAAAAMEAEERQILARLGIPDPYAEARDG